MSYEITQNDINYCDALTYKLCRRYGIIPTEDHIQEGRLGMVIASKKYDPERGVKFMSYAVNDIRAKILGTRPQYHPDGFPNKRCVYYLKLTNSISCIPDFYYKDTRNLEEEYADFDYVSKVLSKMPDNLRQAVIGKALYGYNYKDLRKDLGLAPGSLETLLYDWRKTKGKKLKERL